MNHSRISTSVVPPGSQYTFRVEGPMKSPIPRANVHCRFHHHVASVPDGGPSSCHAERQTLARIPSATAAAQKGRLRSHEHDCRSYSVITRDVMTWVL